MVANGNTLTIKIRQCNEDIKELVDILRCCYQSYPYDESDNIFKLDSILKIEDFFLTGNEDTRYGDIFACNEKGKWLTNNAITKFIKSNLLYNIFFNEHHAEISFHEKIALFAAKANNINDNVNNPIPIDDIIKDRQDLKDMIFDSVKRHPFPYFIAPYNVGGDHWNILIIDFEHKIIFLQEPFGSTDQTIKTAKDIRDKISGISNELNTKMKDFKLATPKFKQQSDGYNCGIYSALNAIKYITDETYRDAIAQSFNTKGIQNSNAANVIKDIDAEYCYSIIKDYANTSLGITDEDLLKNITNNVNVGNILRPKLQEIYHSLQLSIISALKEEQEKLFGERVENENNSNNAVLPNTSTTTNTKISVPANNLATATTSATPLIQVDSAIISKEEPIITTTSTTTSVPANNLANATPSTTPLIQVHSAIISKADTMIPNSDKTNERKNSLGSISTTTIGESAGSPVQHHIYELLKKLLENYGTSADKKIKIFNINKIVNEISNDTKLDQNKKTTELTQIHDKLKEIIAYRKSKGKKEVENINDISARSHGISNCFSNVWKAIKRFFVLKAFKRFLVSYDNHEKQENFKNNNAYSYSYRNVTNFVQDIIKNRENQNSIQMRLSDRLCK